MSTLTDRQLARYRAERAKGFPVRTALAVVRGAATKPKYPFLAEFDIFAAVSCDVDGFDVDVTVEQDTDVMLGEDDVTGWFTDSYEPGCIRNTISGSNGSSYTWYHPSNYDLTELGRDGSTHGMSKSVAADYIRERIAQAMVEDANRNYFGVIVTVSRDDEELASASLWKIDSLPDDDSGPYLREVAEELIEEAVAQAKNA